MENPQELWCLFKGLTKTIQNITSIPFSVFEIVILDVLQLQTYGFMKLVWNMVYLI
jgi:hypothetical protein